MNKRCAAGQVRLKRAYEAVESSDGLRVLIDRLWPRGVSKDAAAVDLWLKDLAPSSDLRRWFGHDPARWPEFQRRYSEEVRRHPETFERLRDLACKQRITLVYAAKDEEHNDAVVLRSLLLGAGNAGEKARP